MSHGEFRMADVANRRYAGAWHAARMGLPAAGNRAARPLTMRHGESRHEP